MENASGNGGAEAALGITPDTGFAAVDTENILATERGTALAAFAVAWSTKPTTAALHELSCLFLLARLPELRRHLMQQKQVLL